MNITTMTIQLIEGDCLEVLPQKFTANHFDAVITDPPYGLKFMGREWDHGVPSAIYWTEIFRVSKPGAHLLAFGGTRTFHRLTCAIEDAGWEIRDCVSWLYGGGFPKSNNCLKPAWEPIILARKKGDEINLQIDPCRIPYVDEADRDSATPQGKCTSKNSGAIGAEPDAGREMSRVEFTRPELLGRWPANVIHDGSDDVLENLPITQSGTGAIKKRSSASVDGNTGAAFGAESRPYGTPMICYGDKGSAARFFYCAKAPKSDRGEGNNWPTVKPTELMRYLCRLITPPNGLILDPFMGSGSTGKAALLEGFRFVGIDKEGAAVAIAQTRVQEEK